MTTNQERAAEIIHQHHDNCTDAANYLDLAGLITPGLPKPNRADEDGTLEWHIPDPNQPYPGIVRLYPNGHIRLVQINAPITSVTTALALSQALAAAAYVQAHQEKK